MYMHMLLYLYCSMLFNECICAFICHNIKEKKYIYKYILRKERKGEKRVMKKVFLIHVSDPFEDGDSLLHISSSREKAERWIEENEYFHAQISEWDVD